MAERYPSAVPISHPTGTLPEGGSAASVPRPRGHPSLLGGTGANLGVWDPELCPGLCPAGAGAVPLSSPGRGPSLLFVQSPPAPAQVLSDVEGESPTLQEL